MSKPSGSEEVYFLWQAYIQGSMSLARFGSARTADSSDGLPLIPSNRELRARVSGASTAGSRRYTFSRMSRIATWECTDALPARMRVSDTSLRSELLVDSRVWSAAGSKGWSGRRSTGFRTSSLSTWTTSTSSVEQHPSPDQLGGHTVEEDDHLLGLYEGIPLTEREDYGMVLPDKITLFQVPIEEICSNDDEVIEEVRQTVVHEVAHHFGHRRRHACTTWECSRGTGRDCPVSVVSPTPIRLSSAGASSASTNARIRCRSN